MTGVEVAPPAPPAEADTETRSLREAISGVFPDWQVWHDHAGWHGRRRGSWWQTIDPADGVYAIHSPHPGFLVAMLDAQDRVRRATLWDAPPRQAPARPHLEQLAGQAQPIDLARDMIAGRIEAEFPGWLVDHDVAGWTAAWMADPRYRVTAQSSAEIRARLPRPGRPPRWRID